MKRYVSVLFTVILSFSLLSGCKSETEPEPVQYLVGLTNQYSSRIEVHDLAFGELSDESLVWSVDVAYDAPAGLKYRNTEKFGEVVAVACGEDGYGCLVSYPSGELLWSTNAAAQNPHSIEVMPNGVVAIASSSGHAVRFFTTDSERSKNYDAEVYLYDAHGVLWDDERQLLWALGNRVLTAYRVELTDGELTVTEEAEYYSPLPIHGGHDLTVDYSTPDCLLITSGAAIYRYDIESSTYTEIFDDKADFNYSWSSGVGTFKDGNVVFIRADKKYKAWTSMSLNFVKKTDDGYENSVISSQTEHYYKCRVWQSNYL